MTVLHLDYETYSRVDLIACGAHRYAQSDTTGIHCLGWAFDDDEPEIWTPAATFPFEVRRFMVAGEFRSLHAHNAQFERLITKHVLSPLLGMPAPPLDAWYCTAAQARARALPASLDDLGRCLELPTQKDKRGKELIRKLCVPRVGNAVNFEDGEFLWETDPEAAYPLLRELYDYCAQDVIVERFAEQCSEPLSDTEFDDYLVNELINDRGIRIDLDFARAASEYAAEEAEEIGALISELTDGQITTAKQHARNKKFIEPYLDIDELRHAVTRYKTDRITGETSKKITFDGAARERIIEIADEQPDLIPEDVVELARLVGEASRSSVSKYLAMQRRANGDERAQGSYIYAGAGQTKRYSSKGLQLHNMVRASRDDFEEIKELIIDHGALPEGEVMDTLATCMRQSLIAADGHVLVWGDWSSIEAVTLPWLTGKRIPVLDLYAQNKDIYIPEAAGIFGIAESKVTGEQRQVGKVATLSLGYQGGVNALQSMARNYGVKLNDTFAGQVVGAWRSRNTWAVGFWRDLERAAVRALRNPGVMQTAGRIGYFFEPKRGNLYCRLPNDEYLTYPQAKLERDDRFDRLQVTAIKAQWKPAADSDDDWPRISLYGGLQAENCTQATAGAILRATLADLEDLDWPVIGHTHDEVLMEVEADEADEAREVLSWAMLKKRAWAEGLPLRADLMTAERYRK